MTQLPREGGGPGRVSRRGLLFGGAALAGATLGAAGCASPDVGDDPGLVAFRGEHQAGIVTPAQDRLHFATFDVTGSDRAGLIGLLRRWTAAAEQMCSGAAIGQDDETTRSGAVPPPDTGEALELPPARLTVTVGFGPSLFTDDRGVDRFGVAARRPAPLADLPAFPGDRLDPVRTGGDLCIQACADDPQVAVHAGRNLARIARGVAAVRYSQLGFGRTSSTSSDQRTPRNLMGFKDGTRNLKSEDTEALDEHVWVARDDGPDWMVGGSYLVVRRIRMLIEPWDSTPLPEQERVIGRSKVSGAVPGRSAEFDPPDLAAVAPTGQPLLDRTAHVRLAHPDTNGGAMLLRRGYSFVDGTDGLGRLDAGLFFVAYQRDPRTQFNVINGRLSGRHGDSLNEYIQHVGSGVFACPPGASEHTWWGQRLFES